MSCPGRGGGGALSSYTLRRVGAATTLLLLLAACPSTTSTVRVPNNVTSGGNVSVEDPWLAPLREAERAFAEGDYGGAKRLLQDAVPPREPDAQRRFRDVLVLSSFLTGDFAGAENAFRALSAPSVDLREQLTRFLDARVAPGATVGLSLSADTSTALGAYAVRRAVADLVDLGRGREAAELARGVLDEGVADGALADELLHLLHRLDARQGGVAWKVGVLLPLSGPYQRIGQSALRSLKLALMDAPGDRVALTVRDSAGDARVAAEKAEELIVDERVALLFGPVGAHESAEVVTVAQDYGVPCLVLSAVADLLPTESSSWTFRVRVTDRREVQEVARFAMTDLGSRTFAVLHPDTAYGRELAAFFRDAVSRGGASPLASIPYPPDTTDFRKPVAALRAATKGTALDALFIPDRGESARRIGTYLRAAGVRLRTAPDAKGLQLLGASGWLDARVLDPAEGNTDNAVFAAPFFPDPTDARARTFAATFAERYAVDPTPFEAEVYDSARVVLDALERSDGGAGRAELREAIARTTGFLGVTGVISMLETGESDHAPVLLTVDGDQIRMRASEAEERVLRKRAGTP